MQSDEQLQQQLEAADPAPADQPLDPVFMARLRARIQEQRFPVNTTLTPDTPTPARRPKWLPYTLAGAAAAVVALAIGVGIAVTGDDSGPTAAAKVPAVVERGPDLEPAPPVEGPSFNSCLALSAESLGFAPVAFDGIVTAIDGTNVTFEVTRWFRGGSGDILVTDGVYITGENSGLLGETPVAVGERYLVAAELYSDAVRPGTCGWVQAYSAEMDALFQSAYQA